jgi:cytochrome P450
MTPIFSHINPEVFPDPHSFIPERWLNLSDSERQNLEHYLVPYSRGARQCSGLK